jgi:hypothetical protein
LFLLFTIFISIPKCPHSLLIYILRHGLIWKQFYIIFAGSSLPPHIEQNLLAIAVGVLKNVILWMVFVA